MLLWEQQLMALGTCALVDCRPRAASSAASLSLEEPRAGPERQTHDSLCPVGAPLLPLHPPAGSAHPSVCVLRPVNPREAMSCYITPEGSGLRWRAYGTSALLLEPQAPPRIHKSCVASGVQGPEPETLQRTVLSSTRPSCRTQPRLSRDCKTIPFLLSPITRSAAPFWATGSEQPLSLSGESSDFPAGFPNASFLLILGSVWASVAVTLLLSTPPASKAVSHLISSKAYCPSSWGLSPRKNTSLPAVTKEGKLTLPQDALGCLREAVWEAQTPGFAAASLQTWWPSSLSQLVILHPPPSTGENYPHSERSREEDSELPWP
ncbi:junctional adhesion molecule C isoform X4 [Nycticebus coucang]|uniref:junctional adhesion molecule C isoform X4 n=1 Tax=Nycticebus coucang TaxID=9470 RepID=UPI00234C8730|nr:junctional adhesion molecule C isoform X4 [Nycticebus coucang]